MDFDFTTVIHETQIEQTSPFNSQRDLSPEEAGKRHLYALLELKNPALRLEATTPLLIKHMAHTRIVTEHHVNLHDYYFVEYCM